MKSKIPVNLENYPALLDMAGRDKEGFLSLMKNMFAIANGAVQNEHDKVSKKYFNIELPDLISQMLQAVFDHKGIMQNLPNQENAETISELYGHAINPLHAAFTKKGLQNHKGEDVSFEEKFGMKEDEYSVKRWLQGLFFYSYYCDLKDLAQALSLSDYAFIEDEKHENIGKLLELKPILAYQKAIGILPGKLYEGTGFFDGGDLNGSDSCPACKHPPDSLFSLGEETICTNCQGAFRE